VIFNTIIHSWELALFIFFKWCAARWRESKKNGRVEAAQKSDAKLCHFHTISGQKQIQENVKIWTLLLSSKHNINYAAQLRT